MPDREYLTWCRRWMEECHRLLMPDGSLWVLIDHKYQAEYGVLLKSIGLTIRSNITWYETFGVNCANSFNRCSRRLFWCVKNPKQFVFNPDPVTHGPVIASSNTTTSGPTLAARSGMTSGASILSFLV